MEGILYGIGVGPGDPELLTLKAVRQIKECDIIAVPGEEYHESIAYKIAVQAVPELKEKPVLGLLMPMVKDKEILKAHHTKAAEQVISHLKKGESVGFLTLGDVSLYATYLYIHRMVGAAGYETRMISGVPSFCAAAARLDMGLAEGSEQLHVLPASYDVKEALALPGTKVLMKSGRQLSEVKELLQQGKKQVAMVENCGMAQERVCYGAEGINTQAGYYTLLVVKDL